MVRKIFLYLILSALTALIVVGGVFLWMGPAVATEFGVAMYLAILVLIAAILMYAKGKFFKTISGIILFAILTFALAVIFQAAIFWNTALCGNCGPGEIFLSPGEVQRYLNQVPATTDISPTSKLAGDSGFKLIYSSDNGPLPPNYHREEAYIVYEKNVAGKIIVEHTTSDYSRVLKKEELSVDRDQFNLFISQALSVKSAKDSDSLAGCTGGSSKRLQVFKDGKVIFKTSSYSCASESSNESLESFSLLFHDALNRIVE